LAATSIDNPNMLTQCVPQAPYGKGVGAIHRGLEILELFAVEQVPLTVNEISTKLGFPQSSTSVLLHGLTDLGYLAHDRRARTFYPTVRVTFLGMWLQHRILDHGSLLHFMESLAHKSGHVVLLATQNGLHAQYMHIVSARISRVGLKPGLMRPICRAAVGKVLLATKHDDEILRIVRNANAIETTLAPVNGEQLLGEIQECRRSGFAFSFGNVTAGSSVIATRVPVDIAGAPIAIGIGVHTHEFEALREPMMALLRTALDEYFSSVGASDAAGVWTPVRQEGYAVSARGN
jgi:DNA-binding IclR family transcriptional regulator